MCKSPLPFIFLWSDPLLSYGMKPGFAEKQFFKLRKIVFFRTCLECFQSTQNLYVDRLGDLKHCFPNNLMNTTLPRIFFFHPALVKLRQARLCKKKNQALKIVFFCALLLWNSDKPGFAKKNQALKIVFFVHCSYETQTSPALQKKTGSIFFFSMSLVNCGGNLLAFKNKNLRDPRPQAFGFLTNSRAVTVTVIIVLSTCGNDRAAGKKNIQLLRAATPITIEVSRQSVMSGKRQIPLAMPGGTEPINFYG